MVVFNNHIGCIKPYQGNSNFNLPTAYFYYFNIIQLVKTKLSYQIDVGTLIALLILGRFITRTF